ncbi:helix-turn-helix domain-containing protein [Rathayibacter sp. Leaf296]|uniref:helix-turn-helix domain-containing protein n=1 Tax=Rathayibacter sp. Leaf296 TaxID=1736327 RepID=UPI0007027201|nr:helix-turn-helix domain-containing protein [Rathayibacter sp. Leaf296]KQQ08043.1 hypothetical protein ASF46_11810 [Rathayibacter sp. Leaf296]
MTGARDDISAGRDRDVILRGPAVHDWFARREQIFETGAAPPQLFADEIVSGSFAAARIWHTAGTVRTGKSGGGDLRVLLQIESVAHLVADGRAPLELPAGSIAVLPPEADPLFAAQRPTARIELRFEAPPTLRGLAESTAPQVFSRDTPFFAIVVATVNSVLNSDMSPSQPGFSNLRSAAENLGLALVLSCFGGAELPGTREADLYRLAMARIDRDASRPELTVEVLARELAVSRRYLTRVFTAHGTTARDEIRRARLRLAREYFERGDAGAAHVARRSGFGSPRRLRDALDR